MTLTDLRKASTAVSARNIPSTRNPNKGGMMMAEEKKIDTEVDVETEVKEVAEVKDNTKADKKKDSKNSKPGFGRKMLKFFKDCKSEITKKIVWYSKKQLVKSTALVLVCLVVISAVVCLFDLGISRLIMWVGRLI